MEVGRGLGSDLVLIVLTSDPIRGGSQPAAPMAK